jgi:hypothetical protein
VPRLKKAARQDVGDRLLTTIAHNCTITHAGVPNPDYVADSDIPRYAAICFPNCVPSNDAQRLLDQVKELKDVRSRASLSQPLPAPILTTNYRPRCLSHQRRPIWKPSSRPGLVYPRSEPCQGRCIPPQSRRTDLQSHEIQPPGHI